MKKFAFIETRNKNEVICKEVNSNFVRSIQIIHMRDRARAIQKFQMEYTKPSFGGKRVPRYNIVVN